MNGACVRRDSILPFLGLCLAGLVSGCASPGNEIRNLISAGERRGKVISVPWEKQADSTSCGAAALASVYAYHGVEEPQEEIASRIRTGWLKLNRHDLMVKDCRNRGLQVEVSKGGSLETIKRALDDEKPVIAVVWDRLALFRHAVVITGYDEEGEQLLVSDPASGPDSLWSYDAFRKAWARAEGFYLTTARGQSNDD